MITHEQIATVLDHPLYDADGDKIGDTKDVFLDDVSGEPEWVTVETGLFGTSESFVPMRDATMIEDHLEVPYPKAMVKDAPSVHAGGSLSADEEHRLYEHYGIARDEAPGRQGTDRPDGGGRTRDDSRSRSYDPSLPYDNTTASGIARSGKEDPGAAPRSGRSERSDSGSRSGGRDRSGAEGSTGESSHLRRYMPDGR